VCVLMDGSTLDAVEEDRFCFFPIGSLQSDHDKHPYAKVRGYEREWENGEGREREGKFLCIFVFGRLIGLEQLLAVTQREMEHGGAGAGAWIYIASPHGLLYSPVESIVSVLADSSRSSEKLDEICRNVPYDVDGLPPSLSLSLSFLPLPLSPHHPHSHRIAEFFSEEQKGRCEALALSSDDRYLLVQLYLEDEGLSTFILYGVAGGVPEYLDTFEIEEYVQQWRWGPPGSPAAHHIIGHVKVSPLISLSPSFSPSLCVCVCLYVCLFVCSCVTSFVYLSFNSISLFSLPSYRFSIGFPQADPDTLLYSDLRTTRQIPLDNFEVRMRSNGERESLPC
jgi:hypothetical protein